LLILAQLHLAQAAKITVIRDRDSWVSGSITITQPCAPAVPSSAWPGSGP